MYVLAHVWEDGAFLYLLCLLTDEMSQGLFKTACHSVAYYFERLERTKIPHRGILGWIVLCPHEGIPGTMKDIPKIGSIQRIKDSG